MEVVALEAAVEAAELVEPSALMEIMELLALLTEIAAPTAMAEQEELLAVLTADQADEVDDPIMETRATQELLVTLAM